MEQKFKYACIGAGGIARKKHLNGYGKLSNVQLVAICDVDYEAAKKLADEFGIPEVYTDYQQMFEEKELDIVSVCTPNATHKSITIHALEHGCHAHVEKPIALNCLEAREILQAEAKTGKKVLVGMNKRFLGYVVLLKRLLHENYFGSIYHVRCGWERNSGIPGVGRWYTDRKLSGGGALIDLGVHYLDLAMYMMNWPNPDKAIGALNSNFLFEGNRIRRGYQSANGIIDVEDAANGTVIMKEGQTLDYCFSWASNIEKEIQYLEAYGTKAGFRLVNSSLQLYTQLGGVMFTLIPDELTMPLDENECASFIKNIQNDTQPEATVEQAVKVMELIDMIYSLSVSWRERAN
jgi:predicted dehydrogenase